MMWMNMLQFGNNIMLRGLMNANVSKITMYKLGTFRSLSVFKGKAHVNVPLIKIGTQDPSPLKGNWEWRSWWNRNESHVQLLKRLPKLTLLKDKVYIIGKKKGKIMLIVFSCIIIWMVITTLQLRNAST